MFLKQLFLIIVLSINALHYSVLIHGSPLRYVVSWNHIAFNSKLPSEIQAHFHQLFLLFQEVTWLFILSIRNFILVCLVDTPNFQSYTSGKPFVITICLYDSTHLPIIPDGVCLLEDHNVSNLQIPFIVCPFLPFLKWLHKLFPPVTPEFIYCFEPTSIFCSCINQVLKNLLDIARFYLIL